MSGHTRSHLVRTARAACAIVAFAAAACCLRVSARAEEPAPATAPATLYRRLGGYDSLAVLTDDFMARMLKDASLSRYFASYSGDAKNRIRQLVLDQLCAASGGPCFYPGRDMRSVHKGLGIREADWAATVGHLIATLNKREIGPKEKGELLAIAAGLKKDIVEKP